MILILVIGVVLFPCMVSAQVEAGQIAFTGTIQESKVFGGNGVVKYPAIITNHAGGFSKATGKFTVPRNGLYVFSFHSVTKLGKKFLLDLMHNDKYIASALGRDSDDTVTGGNTVVLRAVKGDQVFVKSYYDDFDVYAQPTEVYTTFSGFILGLLSIPDEFL